MTLTSTVSAASEEPWLQTQVVLILCGLIASGKSTFAEELQKHYPQFQRCNQDDLGDRRRVEHLARDTLRRGLSVCIDRTNFNASQRSHWIEIAREFPGTSIWVIVFDTPYNVCADRLRTRISHPTIKTPEQGLSILSRFAGDFEQPTKHEGYDRIIHLKHTDHPLPMYSRSEIASILLRIHNSPDSIMTSNIPKSFRGHSLRRHSRGNFGPSRNYAFTGRVHTSMGSPNRSAGSWQPGHHNQGRGSGARQSFGTRTKQVNTRQHSLSQSLASDRSQPIIARESSDGTVQNPSQWHE